MIASLRIVLWVSIALAPLALAFGGRSSATAPLRGTARSAAPDRATFVVDRAGAAVAGAGHATLAAPPGRSGPAIVQIDALAASHGPVRFDHRRHAAMADLAAGCAACHHESDAIGTVVAACDTCHPDDAADAALDLPSLRGAYHRQCLGCHREWQHANACGSCHEPAAPGAKVPAADATDIVGIAHPAASPAALFTYRTAHAAAPFVTFDHAAHAAGFGLACADCHRGASCATCHDPDGRGATVDRTATCGACHDVSNTDRCAMCHDRGPREPFDHCERSGWNPGPQHARVACNACHGAPDAFAVPRSTSCRGCHGRSIDVADFDHAIVGVPLAGSHRHFACSRCHRDRGPEAKATCRGCHPDRSYPAELPGIPAEPRTSR